MADTFFWSGRFLRRLRRVGGLLCALLLLACTPVDRPWMGLGLNVPQRFRDGAESAPVLLRNERWWQHFEDPWMESLIAQALEQNLDLAVAVARVERAKLETAALDDGVTGTATASATGTFDDDGPFSTTRSGLVTFDWLLDPFGARAATQRASFARADIAEVERDASQLLLTQNLLSSYVRYRHAQRVLVLRQNELGARQNRVAQTQRLLTAGAATELDLTQVRAQVAELQRTLPTARVAVRRFENEIAILLAAFPGQSLTEASDRGQSKALLPAPARSAIPTPQIAPNLGIPTDLLRNRPDIRVAELRFAAAIADLDAAEAARFPSLSVGGTITLSGAPSLGLGPRIAFPDFIGGGSLARARARAEDAKIAHLGWQQSVLSAVSEVENALLSYESATEAANAAVRAERLNLRARSLSEVLFDGGELTLSDLLEADEAVATARIAVADNQLSQALSFVDLNVAVGSGHAAASDVAE